MNTEILQTKGELSPEEISKAKKKARDKAYYEANREKRLARDKAYYEANREKRIAQAKAKYESNKDQILSQLKEKYHLDAEDSRKRLRERRKANRDQVNERQRKYWKDWWSINKDNPFIKITQSARSRISEAIRNKSTTRSGNTTKLLGCTFEQLYEHLESLFKNGMTWENYGRDGWHVDHIRPCSSFNLADPEQQKQCFHYTNLQPLWWYENLSKGDKWDC